MPNKKFHPFWPRLMAAMDAAGHKQTQTAVADLLGIHQTSVWKWKEGGYPEMARAVELAQKLNVSVEWLLTGRGARQPMAALPAAVQELVSLALRLPTAELGKVRGYTEALLPPILATKPQRRK